MMHKFKRKLIAKLNRHLFQYLYFRMVMDFEDGKIKKLGLMYFVKPKTGWGTKYETLDGSNKIVIYWLKQKKIQQETID